MNEYSTRYSDAIDSAQATPPGGWRLQSRDNKQGSGGTVPGAGWDDDWSQLADDLPPPNRWVTDPQEYASPGHYLSAREGQFHDDLRELYQERLHFGVAREQARKDLPLSTYTEAYWKCDLRNILHFLALRMDSHAQKEIRDYATIIGHEIVAKLFPLAWEAFCDYTLGALTLSRVEVEAIVRISGDRGDPWVLFANKREREEFRAKLICLGLAGEISDGRTPGQGRSDA